MENNPYFNTVFQELERLSPGGVGTSRKMMKHIPEEAEISILDVGCGKGNSTLAMAKKYPNARIIAIDTNKEYIRNLNQQVATLGLTQQVQGMVMSMEEMEFPPGQFDVIWAEGSIYLLGFETALSQWKTLLRPGGLLICNDLCWKSPRRSPAYTKNIEAVFGPLTYYKEKSYLAQDKGYELVTEFVQPVSDWTQGYYVPMAEQLELLEVKHPRSKKVKEVVSHLRGEIDLYENYSPFYAYVFFVLKRGEEE